MELLKSGKGKVFLVGAGPGDPELITLKGARILRQADVVVYDRLVHRDLLDMSPSSAERISVAKKGGHYSFPQQQIHQLLVQKARQGLQVVRLKGGDPFLFGRGGEEALYLLEHGVPFEVVPGITSALAAPASAGVPATHRGFASSVAFVTGHQADATSDPVDWRVLATAVDTLVVLMPVKNLRWIVSQLVLHGRSLDTPAAMIQWGTREEQRQVFSDLKNIVSAAHRESIQSPAVLVVGRVVEVGQQLVDQLVSARSSGALLQQRSIEQMA